MGIVFRLSKRNPKELGSGLVGYEVLARFHARSDMDLYARTGVFAPERYTDINGNTKMVWDNGMVVVPRMGVKDAAIRKMLAETRDRLADIERAVNNAYSELVSRRGIPYKDWLQDVLDGKDGNAGDFRGKTLTEVLAAYISDGHAKVSHGTLKHYIVLLHKLQRYDDKHRSPLMLEDLSTKDLDRIAKFIGEGRSENYVVYIMKKLRTFVRWANGMSKDDPIEPITVNNPFLRYSLGTELYGTPYYITVEERNRIYSADMPSKHLEVQRDIFVFQCMIGCRVGDLLSRTKNDVIAGALEYIPRKTKDGRPVTVRVPLNSIGVEILDKYKDCGEKLLPFISAQKYNDAIKEVFRAAGITRMVTVLNPVTREEEKKLICDVASSHMARRTFIGNLYKQVKDPNLVGKLSGHTENSRAFARYRDIDEDMAKELVKMLE